MLTLKRMKALSGSFGADLGRWPAELREPARLLLAQSAEARALLEQARRLDDRMTAATEAEMAQCWPSGEPDAALARLRAAVSARIAAPPRRRLFRMPVLGPVPSLRWAGLAAGGGIAILAGLWVATLDEPLPPDMVSAMLQPAPMMIFENEGEK